MGKSTTLSVTIRLPKDLVEWLDSQIDGTNIRNRTHIIEKSIREYQEKIS